MVRAPAIGCVLLGATLLTAACSGGSRLSPPHGVADVLALRSESVRYFFSGRPDGDLPTVGHLTFDRHGDLYGATSTGGTGTCKFRGTLTGCGTIFELRPSSKRTWSERVIYSFKNLGDGAGPYGTLSFDSAGHIYGVTMGGGNRGCVPLFWIYRGCGTAFELMRSGNRHWTKRTLHVFSGAADGGNPVGGLVIDSSGNLYGTAYCGESQLQSCYTEGEGDGVFFELEPKKSGSWSEAVLHVFGRHLHDGLHPLGDLTVNAGKIYGTADNVYAMTRASSKSRWRFTQLFEFGDESSQGSYPNGGLAVDAAGNMYGTMGIGGNPSCDCGLIFELHRVGGSLQETILHTFTGGSDGARPDGALTIDSAGLLYGTTSNGGDLLCNNGGGCGVAFVLHPHGVDSTERVLHTFEDDATDGGMPESALVLVNAGSLYGTTEYGGKGPNLGDGTVFEIER